jgi:hypothetical protein
VSTDLFQALTLGLLVIVILALLVAVSMLGKVRAALETRPATGEPKATTPTDEAGSGAPATVAEAVADVTGVAREAVESSGGGAGADPAAEPSTDDETTADDSERPFERGGRWYFRRAGELLVYEEGTGEWVPAGDDRPARSTTGASTAESIQVDQGGGQAGDAVERQTAAVEASNEPPVAGVAEERPAHEAERAIARSNGPSTSFAGQPLAAAEEEAAALGEPVGAVAVAGEDAAVATGFEEPGGGAVDLAEATATSEEPATTPTESFWKCASCGAINGSTATSCRMCFNPRP